jgi:hypothetical protein
MRAVAWNDNHGTEPGAFLPSAHLVYEGNHTYTYDLWDESPETLDLGSPWKSNPWLYNLRLDPLEVAKQTRFSLDDVKLTAEPRPNSSGIFPIKFNLQGAGNYTVKIWASPTEGNLISTSTDMLINTYQSLSRGDHVFNWNMSGLPNQSRWFIKVEVLISGMKPRIFSAAVPIITGVYLERIPPTTLIVPPIGGSPGSPTATPADKLVLAGSKLSRRRVREGEYITFQTQIKIASGDRLKRIRAQLESSRRRYSVSLRALGNGKYSGKWRAVRGARSSQVIFKVQLSAETTKGLKESNALGSIVVRKR